MCKGTVQYLYRIHEAKKITKRYRKDIKLLVERLDGHGDQFRTASLEIDTKPEVTVRPPKAGGKTPTVTKPTEKPSPANPKKSGTKRKSKADKVCGIFIIVTCKKLSHVQALTFIGIHYF